MNNDSFASVLPPKRPLSMDGVQRREQARTQQQRHLPPAAPVVQPRRFRTPRPATAKKHRLWQKLQLPLLLLAGTTGGFVAGSLLMGISLLAVYAICAFVFRIPSRTTFLLALLLLIAISGLLLLKPERQLTGNFATYAFVLLLIGVVTLGKESRMPKSLRRRYRR